MWTVMLILVLIIILLAYKLYKCHVEKTIFDNVKWCVSYDPYSSFSSEYTRPELKQHGYIIHLQTEMALEEKYRIVESDYDGVNEILKSYQQDLLRRYFKGYAPAYSKLSQEDYFIVTFGDFLQRQQSEYSSTNYAVTYHKLSYISNLSSRNIYKKGR